MSCRVVALNLADRLVGWPRLAAVVSRQIHTTPKELHFVSLRTLSPDFPSSRLRTYLPIHHLHLPTVLLNHLPACPSPYLPFTGHRLPRCWYLVLPSPSLTQTSTQLEAGERKRREYLSQIAIAIAPPDHIRQRSPSA